MLQMSPTNIERLRRLGLQVLWEEGRYCAYPVQTAVWTRDAFWALWNQFSSNEAGRILGKNGIGMSAVSTYLKLRFPAFYSATNIDANEDFTAEADRKTEPSAKSIFSLLSAFGDFSHVGHGIYIPRETRLIHIAPDWVRIAGTLNISGDDLPNESAKELVPKTLGRAFSLTSVGDNWPRAEPSPLMVQGKLRILDGWIAPIVSRVVEKPVFDFSEAKFYTVKHSARRAVIGWDDISRHVGLCLCRLNKSNYMLANVSPGSPFASAYCDVNGDERKFLEHHFRRQWQGGTKAILRHKEEEIEVQLKFSLPKLIETELLAASASFQYDDDGVWIKTITFPKAASPYVATLLSALEIELLP